MHKCLVCSNKKFNQILNLNKQPLANSLRVKKNFKQKKYPLNLIHCKKCSTVQLDHVVDPKKLFKKYVWTTNSSKFVKTYAKEFFKKFDKKLSRNSKILEIASNDGTFLKYFKTTSKLGSNSSRGSCSETFPDKINLSELSKVTSVETGPSPASCEYTYHPLSIVAFRLSSISLSESFFCEKSHFTGSNICALDIKVKTVKKTINFFINLFV